ncbi:hypothetical protein ONR57_22625 [Hoyosella sp. YIM 151337]|uniref:hypothetical protein n=1 Tax=Hoyosella sp. YIM 151337 TaxID=2992742 RepID=UPI0022365879|nr:hypothetical protein [Hoyosella sp. YIM 151337]MCW4356104.1 hypothetical protein [Hoyosella sp. YIM 151337]
MTRSPAASARPDWLSTFLGDNKSQRGLIPKVKDAPDAPNGVCVYFEISGGVRSGAAGNISADAIPAGQSVSIHLPSVAEWTISDVRSDSGVHLKLYKTSYGVKGALHFDESVKGRVELDLDDGQIEATADEHCAGTLVHKNGALVAGSKGLGGLRVELNGGKLAGGEFRTVHLTHRGEIFPSSGVLSIEKLIVRNDNAILNLAGNNGQSKLDLIESSGDRPAVLSVQSVGQRRDTRPLTVNKIRDIIVAADSSMTIAVKDEAANTRFRGSVNVDFDGTSVGDRVIFESNRNEAPSVSAKPGAVIEGVEGELTIAGIQGAQISGAPGGFLIKQIKDTHKIGGQPLDTPCKGALLSGFRVPDGLRGRSMLNLLDDAHHIEPSTKSLPGWELGITGWLTSGKTRAEARVRQSGAALRHDAELMRKMRELTREKGASGAARTKVGWCAQRLRHETTQGRTERAALWVYRVLGYGERPGPPFVTWLLLAFVVVCVANFPTTWAEVFPTGWPDVGNFMFRWVERAASPFGAIVGSGTGTEIDSWQYLVRAFIAVPLVIFILALRNYVRSGS